MPLTAHIRILYNPDMKDLWFIIPGMAALLLQTQSIVLTASAVVREREMGTIEQLLVTPGGSREAQPSRDWKRQQPIGASERSTRTKRTAAPASA